jgi:hypothetical protein
LGVDGGIARDVVAPPRPGGKRRELQQLTGDWIGIYEAFAIILGPCRLRAQVLRVT